MQLYIEERKYFCAIHLAAAAEELFGKHLPAHERIHTIVRNAQQGLQDMETGLCGIVDRIVRDRVDPRLRDDFTRLVFLGHLAAPQTKSQFPNGMKTR
jgi:hypothetical protein